MFRLFRKSRPQERQRTEALKAVARAVLGLDENTSLSISEIQCGNPSCPGTETVVLVMRPGAKTRLFRVPAPLMEIDEEELRAALREEG
jgi:hypothetical protein